MTRRYFLIPYNTDTHSDTTDTRLINAHILRTELQLSMGSATGGGLVRGGGRPQILKEFFNKICPPPDFGGFCSEIFNSIIKVFRAERMKIDCNKNFKFSLNFSLKFS